MVAERGSVLWRWRRNPLRRREDVIEGWILVFVWITAVLGAPLAGVLAAQSSLDSASQWREEHRRVRAVLVSDAYSDGLPSDIAENRAHATVRWTASDGTRHSGGATVDEGLRAGSRVTLWTDRQDHLKSAPPAVAGASADAALTGTACSLTVIGAAAAGYCGAHSLLDRRRAAAWGAEWRSLMSPDGRASG